MVNFFKRKKKTIYISRKHSFNDEIVFYPSEKGWEKIHELFGDKYIEERKTDEGGYKDLLWQIMEDYGEYFFHGADFLETTTFELIEKM